MRPTHVICGAVASLAVAYGVAEIATRHAPKAQFVAASDAFLVSDVHLQVNRRWPGPDPSLPDGQFDCDDYAQMKANILRRLGYQVRLLTVWLPMNQGKVGCHMVVELADGRILDNRYSAVTNRKALERAGYRGWREWTPGMDLVCEGGPPPVQGRFFGFKPAEPRP